MNDDIFKNDQQNGQKGERKLFANKAANIALGIIGAILIILLILSFIF